MKLIATILLLMAGCVARERPALYRLSVIAHAVSIGIDTGSSMGRRELNPVLGRGQFGGKQAAIMCSVSGGAMIVQHLIVRRRPQERTKYIVANFTAAGVHIVIAGSNFVRR